MIIIDNALVEELLTMKDCIDVQEEAFRGLPSGRSIHRPRIDMYYPCERDDGYFRWGTMEGASGNYFAIRMKSDIMTWPTSSSGAQTMDKYCIRPGTYCGLILLVSTRNGEPLAFINDGILQHMRVGGGAGLGAKYLARADAHIVGMLGSGGMARTYLEAFTCVRDIKQCRIYSPNREHREAFAAEMAATCKIEVVPVDSAREAVRGADIVSACTDSIVPVFDPEWLEPGMHVTNVNLNELADGALERFDAVVRQGSLGLEMPESGRFRKGLGGSPGAFVGGTDEEIRRIPQPATTTLLLSRNAGNASEGRAAWPDFTDLASGKFAGRTSDRDITFYLNAGNQGLQFSCVGGWVYEVAVKQKRGRELPTEWFLQDIRD
jgi:alanine dehydrogenase